MFRFSFLREEKLKVRKIFVKSLSNANFSMTKKRRFTVYKLLCIFFYLCTTDEDLRVETSCFLPIIMLIKLKLELLLIHKHLFNFNYLD